MREIADPLLSFHSSLRLGGPAIAKIIVENDEDLERLPERLKYWGGRPLWLGRGTNLLAGDGKLPYVLVQIANSGIEILGQKNNQTLVRVGAGTPLPRLLNFCLKHGLSGLEGLTGIPGSAGGAAAMNAGSFGTDAASCIHSVSIWNNGRKIEVGKEDIKSGYRIMSFAGYSEALVTEIIFALTHLSINVIFNHMRHNFLQKKSRQPVHDWSAGCAFKNPEGAAAGKLLEDAGFKGKTLEGMAFSPKHANFLINTGKGSAKAAFELLEMAREKVFSASGHRLELEIRTVL